MSKKVYKVRTILVSLFIVFIVIFIGVWIATTTGQVNGKYMKQAYPVYVADTSFETKIKSKTFLAIFGDGTCQFPRREGTNIVE